MLLTYRALVLFDIDGTLVRRAGPDHREALVHGVRRVTGLETTTEGIPVQGMLDPDILTAMMRQAGARRGLIRDAMPGILRAAERYYVRVCPVLEGKHCPGVVPALERLTRRGVLLGLVTGNLTRIGWRKLERAGLRGYFRFGAFGEMAKNRAGSSWRQKYSERNNSWRQTICAPLPAASRMRHSALARFSLGSREQAIWTRPMRNLERCTEPL